MVLKGIANEKKKKTTKRGHYGGYTQIAQGRKPRPQEEKSPKPKFPSTGIYFHATLP